MPLLTKLSPKYADFELTEDNCSSEISSTYQDPIAELSETKSREQKMRHESRVFSRPRKKGAKRGKTDGNCCV